MARAAACPSLPVHKDISGPSPFVLLCTLSRRFASSPPPFPWSISLPLYSRSQQCIPPCLSYFLSLVLSLVLCLVTRSSLARQRSCEKGMLGELYASLRPLRQPVPPLDSRRVAGAEDTWSGLSEARSRGRFDGGGSRNLLDGRPRGGLFNADRTTSVACGTS
jgi:hypothetical protein